MKKIIITVICIFLAVALVVAGISVYNEFFKKNYIFEGLEGVGGLLLQNGEVVAEFNKEERTKALTLIKDIVAYRVVELDNELLFGLTYWGAQDKKISWNEKYIEYDGVVYLADEKALAKLNEYCKSIIAEHNDTTAKKPYELSAEDISAVKLTCNYYKGTYEYDISSEDFAVFSEKVNEITMYQRYNDFHFLIGGGRYIFDVELKNGEVLQIKLSYGNEYTEHVYINDKTYVSDADGLMEFIDTYDTGE